MLLGPPLQFSQNQGAQLGRGQYLASDLDGGQVAPALVAGPAQHLVGQPGRFFPQIAEALAHQPLDRVHGRQRSLHRVDPGQTPHGHLPRIRIEPNHRRKDPAITRLGVLDDDRALFVCKGHQRVGGPQIDPDDDVRVVSHRSPSVPHKEPTCGRAASGPNNPLPPPYPTGSSSRRLS